MFISESKLNVVFPRAGSSARSFVLHLNNSMACFEINSPARAAAFLAQIGHESLQLTRCIESLNYGAQRLAVVWPRRFRAADGAPNALAHGLAYQPERIANQVYANRNGNGSSASGDGWRFRGRGLLQITGRANYARVAKGLGAPLIERP